MLFFNLQILIAFVQVGFGLDILYPLDSPRDLWPWILYFAILAGWVIFFTVCSVLLICKVAEGYSFFLRRSANKQGQTAVVNPGGDDKKDYKNSAIENRISNAMQMSRETNPNFTTFTWETLDEAVVNGSLLVVANGKYVYDVSKWINSHRMFHSH
jgi:hypothetical protein